MDPLTNPFSPSAGAPPPELAGRDELLERVRIAIERVKRGRSEKSVIMVGLRGVGKTVLLDQMKLRADAAGYQTMRIEARESYSLPAMLAPELRLALLRLSRVELARELAKKALRGLAGFVNVMKLKYADIEFGINVEPEPGLADIGDLEHDLQELLAAVGEAAKAGETALVIFIDELQYVEEDQLAALITSLHRMAQRQLPVVLVGAGLPQLRGRMGRAKSYAERLFDFPEIGPLAEDDARIALANPARDEGAAFTDEALDELIRVTGRYPFFIQAWGKHVWDAADASPITLDDVSEATEIAVAALDESFFLVRFDRLTPSEKQYLRAMAELGAGPHRSGDIADVLSIKVETASPRRAKLIDKGMVWSPNHGDTAFTVPLFDEFMQRIIPGEEWKN